MKESVLALCNVLLFAAISGRVPGGGGGGEDRIIGGQVREGERKCTYIVQCTFIPSNLRSGSGGGGEDRIIGGQVRGG